MTDKQREAAKAHFEAMSAYSQAKREVEAASKARQVAWEAYLDAIGRKNKAEDDLTRATAKYEEAMGDSG